MPSTTLRRLRDYSRALTGTVHNALTLSRTLGQARSMAQGKSVDAQGNPVPWFTYPAIEYLRQLDFSAKTVFEFGAGGSTLFWGQRAQHVIAVEHDPAWCMSVQAAAGPNVKLVLAEDEDAYAAAIRATEQQFDVISIDGWYRGACVAPALDHLAAGGMIILDNADWLPQTCARLRDADLLEVDFSGFGPICPWTWTTSAFFSRDFGFEMLPADRRGRPTGSVAPPATAEGL